MDRDSELVLYVRRTCEFCAEAEALLQAEDVAYLRVIVEETETPGHVQLRFPDGTVERIRTARRIQTPSLHDRRARVMRVGLDSIETYLDYL